MAPQARRPRRSARRGRSSRRAVWYMAARPPQLSERPSPRDSSGDLRGGVPRLGDLGSQVRAAVGRVPEQLRVLGMLEARELADFGCRCRQKEGTTPTTRSTRRPAGGPAGPARPWADRRYAAYRRVLAEYPEYPKYSASSGRRSRPGARRANRSSRTNPEKALLLCRARRAAETNQAQIHGHSHGRTEYERRPIPALLS